MAVETTMQQVVVGSLTLQLTPAEAVAMQWAVQSLQANLNQLLMKLSAAAATATGSSVPPMPAGDNTGGPPADPQ